MLVGIIKTGFLLKLQIKMAPNNRNRFKFNEDKY